jgi:hypothetical protein
MGTDVAVVEAEPEGALVVRPGLGEAERDALAAAVRVLEGSTLVGRISTLAGRPLELLGRALPEPAQAAIAKATDLAMRTALRVAIRTMRSGGPGGPARSGRFDTFAAMASGAAGGALGLATLPFELPVSTTLILRSIAGIARDEGEDLSDPATALACLEVFALGSRTEQDDLAQGGYFAVRGALAKTVTQAAKLAAAQGFADATAPAFLRFASQVASRFGVVVSQKVAAGAVPIVGALGGAAVNAAFIEHFRSVARAHFTVRRLERVHGREVVRDAYEEARLRAGLG